jgi:hypothetical protein
MRASRLAGLVLCVVVLGLALRGEAVAHEGKRTHRLSAGAPAYSPLHYWAPTLYRWRAWLSPRPVEYYPPGYEDSGHRWHRTSRRSHPLP